MEKKEHKNKKEDMREKYKKKISLSLVIPCKYQMPNTLPLFIGPKLLKSCIKFKENYDGVYDIRNSLHEIHCGGTEVTKLMTFKEKRIIGRVEIDFHYIIYIS